VTKEKPSFVISRHAPFFLSTLSWDNKLLSSTGWSLVGAPFSSGGRQHVDHKKNYFLGASGAGAGVAAGAGGAGASGGFASSLAAGFGASFFCWHPMLIAAILITRTNARKRKIHFFIILHLLSE
jgi:hypothetical protein